MLFVILNVCLKFSLVLTYIFEYFFCVCLSHGFIKMSISMQFFLVFQFYLQFIHFLRASSQKRPRARATPSALSNDFVSGSELDGPLPKKGLKEQLS